MQIFIVVTGYNQDKPTGKDSLKVLSVCFDEVKAQEQLINSAAESAFIEKWINGLDTTQKPPISGYFVKQVDPNYITVIKLTEVVVKGWFVNTPTSTENEYAYFRVLTSSIEDGQVEENHAAVINAVETRLREIFDQEKELWEGERSDWDKQRGIFESNLATISAQYATQREYIVSKYEDEIDDLKTKLMHSEAECSILASRREKNERRVADLMSEKAEIRIERDSYKEQIDALYEQMTTLNVEIDALHTQLTQANNQIGMLERNAAAASYSNLPNPSSRTTSALSVTNSSDYDLVINELKDKLAKRDSRLSAAKFDIRSSRDDWSVNPSFNDKSLYAYKPIHTCDDVFESPNKQQSTLRNRFHLKQNIVDSDEHAMYRSNTFPVSKIPPPPPPPTWAKVGVDPLNISNFAHIDKLLDEIDRDLSDIAKIKSNSKVIDENPQVSLSAPKYRPFEYDANNPFCVESTPLITDEPQYSPGYTLPSYIGQAAAKFCDEDTSDTSDDTSDDSSDTSSESSDDMPELVDGDDSSSDDDAFADNYPPKSYICQRPLCSRLNAPNTINYPSYTFSNPISAETLEYYNREKHIPLGSSL
jgi:hypothetical protein